MDRGEGTLTVPLREFTFSVIGSEKRIFKKGSGCAVTLKGRIRTVLS
jgi:hypothetical protein